MQGRKQSREFDPRITLSRRDKIPYGSYVAFESLASLFPNAKIQVNKLQPDYWDTLSQYRKNQALIIIGRSFLPAEYEMNDLKRFVENGNTVFISAASFSSFAQEALGIATPEVFQLLYNFGLNNLADSFYLNLDKPPFQIERDFILPGRRFETYLSSWDRTTTTLLGDGAYKEPNFINVRYGKGNFFVHVNPLVFTNYFILHKNNYQYFSQVMSVIPSNTELVVWDEYFPRKRHVYNYNNDDSSKGALSGMLKHQSFRTAFWITLLFLLLYALQEMRRKQRFVPAFVKPKNDSLDFVKTIGRLYYEKKDHTNLARKMAAYFLEHVRNQYKIPTGRLDENFVKLLHLKSGYDESELQNIISFIKKLDVAKINENKLADFYKQLESFYQFS